MKQVLFHLPQKSPKNSQILQNCTLFRSIQNKTQLICKDFADFLKSRTKICEKISVELSKNKRNEENFY
ncbi:hypothetical protein BpHYR1_014078 [Brachionus plicatilis]|uniref:Uncharacterized protein n=1 Tax=Brachionus plicatilis TaxID=10195 RepID=A0A3M7PQE0_BRAPC|nr:hypothetical protein BpHYR1_014078 [Brachionus plicatilis]